MTWTGFGARIYSVDKNIAQKGGRCDLGSEGGAPGAICVLYLTWDPTP